MVKLEKYTGDKNYVFPNGDLADKNAVLEKYPTALDYTWLVHTDDGGEIFLYLYLLSNFRSLYDVPSSMNEAQAMQMIEDKMNNPSTEPGYENTYTQQEKNEFIEGLMEGLGIASGGEGKV